MSKTQDGARDQARERKADAAALQAAAIQRAQATWNDQQERLLRIAQEVLADAATCEHPGNCGHKGSTIFVDRTNLDALRAIVQEISDDAAALVRAAAEVKAEPKPRVLKCDMGEGCGLPVARVDDRGFLYCDFHGGIRKASGIPCRLLTVAEVSTLQAGGTISYSRR